MKKVLLVDDSKVSRMSIRKIMQQLDYEVVGEAIDGEDGLQKIDDLNPDLVITDIEMPNLDGVAMVKEIRKKKNSIDIVVVSSIVNSHLIQEVLNLKATVVKKPVKAEKLLHAIKQLEMIG